MQIQKRNWRQIEQKVARNLNETKILRFHFFVLIFLRCILARVDMMLLLQLLLLSVT